MIAEIVAHAFPELDAEMISVKSFESRDTFFKTQFSIARFATLRRMRATVFVNPRVFELGAPPDGIRAIIAHELSHALYYLKHCRLRLLGLLALINLRFASGWERRTDLVAIERGYGDDLARYREWLYGVVDAATREEKLRDYFTPAEIEMIVEAAKNEPGIYTKLHRKTPRNESETRSVLDCEMRKTLCR